MFELAKKACGVGGPPTRSGVNKLTIRLDQKPVQRLSLLGLEKQCQASGLVVDVPLLIKGQVIDDSNLKRMLGFWGLTQIIKNH